MQIRHACMDDLEQVSELERLCFPPAEAADREAFRARIRTYGNHFLLMFLEGRLISFVNGFVTDLPDLTDPMFSDAGMHREDGAWQMIFGVNTHPDFRRRGFAGRLLREMIREAEDQGRKGLVLTCKEEKVHWYASFGFLDEGICSSQHGGAVWHQMRLTF
ncbi:MAG: GNAT family N-acetyltransferase [Clostridia bacterium]|nr:GNAT family N-acetyltransferase [Clostridia bacterium]